MIAANDHVSPDLLKLAPDQLRAVIAQAVGLLAEDDPCQAVRTLTSLTTACRAFLPMRPDPRPEGGMRSIMAAVAADYGFPVSTLMSDGGRRPVVHARWEFFTRCRAVKWADGSHRYSLTAIGAFFAHHGFRGGRGIHHTTVIHGLRKHAKKMVAAQ